MTSFIVTLVNGWTVVTDDGSFLRWLYDGDPAVEVRTPSRVYHIPASSIVCVQEASE